MSVEHPFPPVVDAACRVLVLGSFPSVKSREEGFFYGHPRNRFWRRCSGKLCPKAYRRSARCSCGTISPCGT